MKQKMAYTTTIKVLNWAFKLFCITGAIIHVLVITEEYFRYEASSSIIMNMADEIEPPDLSVCFRYGDIYDEVAYLSDSNRKPHYAHPGNSKKLNEDISETLTLGEVFKYMPSVAEALLKVKIRPLNEFSMEWLDVNGNAGNKSVGMAITAYHVFTHVCYKVTVNSNTPFPVRPIALSHQSPGIIYKLYFNLSLFKKSQRLLVLTSVDTIQTGLAYAKYPRRFDFKQSGQMSEPFNLMSFSYQKLENNRLPPPYETQCRNYGAFLHYNSLYCVSYCVNQNVVKELEMVSFTQGLNFNKVNRTEVYSRSNILRISQMTTNRTINAIFKSITNHCNQRCRQPSCHSKTFMTKLSEQGNPESPGYFDVSLRVATSPDIHIVYKPDFEFDYFLIYIMSCFGTWLGLSVSDLNPIELWSKYSNRNRIAGNGGPVPERLNEGIQANSRRLQILANENHEFRLTLMKMSQIVINNQQYFQQLYTSLKRN